MSDEEKQPENNLQQTNESEAVNQEEHDGGSVAPEVDLNQHNELEAQSNFEGQETEALDVSVVNAMGENDEVMTAESATDEMSSGFDSDVTVLESLKQENQALKAQLEELNGQCESFKTQSMRIAADFDNFRKRTSKEKEDLEQQIKRVTITELLPVVDNFERARSHIKPQNDGEMAIHKSYQSVYKQLVDSLKRLGVAPMRPEGQEFDPNLHEAVMREPTDQYPEGVVTEQLMRGYMLNDRVLRHAMVKVAAAPEHPSQVSEQDSDMTSE